MNQSHQTHMKKLSLSLAFIAVALINVMASKVEIETARTAAAHFIAGIPGFSLTSDLQLIQTKYASDQQAAYYVFVPSGSEGFIIISAEDALTPVLGYSASGTFSLENTNSNFEGFMQHFADQVSFAREHNLNSSSDVAAAWQHCLHSPTNSRQPLTTVDPLLICMWNQDYPYNAYCPESDAGPGGHVYAGCVATAMSMIMQYYRYPAHGTGSHSYYLPPYGALSANFENTYYNWDAMLNSVGTNSGMAINAVAELQYHCGVAVNMDYGADGSGAQSTKAAFAIKTYFGYSSSAAFIDKADYSSTNWENMIISSLNEKKPLYYSGFTPPPTEGHAFVLDGYQQPGTGNYFHFNFGWSGYQNGFYTLADVNGFYVDEGMITNFYPASNYPSNCSGRTITASIGTFEDGSGPLDNYLNNASCSWLIAPADSVANITLSFNQFSTEANTDILTIYDGDNSAAPVLGTFSGSTLPASVTSTGSRLYITFVTDAANSESGWQAQYNSTYPNYCSGTTILTNATGTFSDGSGIYNCNNNINCKWKILPANANNVILTFTSFNLEEDKDLVSIYATGSNEFLGSFTGNTIPDPIISTTGGILMMLKTNEMNPSAGFDAQYTIDNVNIKENSLFKEMALYPIPTTGYVNLHLNLSQNQSITFSVASLDGKQVYSTDFGSITGNFDQVIDLSGIQKGIYVARVKGQLGSAFDKLIIN
jgi:hypothetical protein